MKTSKPMKRSRIKFRPRPRATAEELAHLAAVKACPCLACYLLGRMDGQQVFGPIEAHHITRFGRKLGHMATISLCRYHHQGHVPIGQSQSSWRNSYGPSVADGRQDFSAEWGDYDKLLELQNTFIKNAVRPASLALTSPLHNG